MGAEQHLNILGIRGIPAAHGGFETFAQRLAQHLVVQGYSVSVYCQSAPGADLKGREDSWNGIHRVHFGTRARGALATMEFDLACVRHVVDQPGVDLVLGYNTALFTLIQKRRGRRVYMNMDGVEWHRQKWSSPAKQWLKLNERIGARSCAQPIADHPGIAAHINARHGREPVIIPYGGDLISDADPAHLASVGFGLERDGYFVSVARIEPENSILEIVQAHARARTDLKLVVLGKLDVQNAYHRQIWTTAGPDVLFPGPIYDQPRLGALRYCARAYVHGHQVGGTNPSLVEALGAGNAVIAHDNQFNRWTAGPDQAYFTDPSGCAAAMARFARDDLALARARRAAVARHAEAFCWRHVLDQYQMLMLGKTSVQIAAE